MNARALLTRAKPVAYAASAYYRRGMARCGFGPAAPPVGIVIERADWAIRWWGEFIAQEANRLHPGLVHTTTEPAELVSGIVEFGSQYQWVEWGRFLSPRCRLVTTFFHGKPEDGPAVARHIERFIACAPRADRIVASCSLARERLIAWGVPEKKVSLIPIGCETDNFVPATPEQQAAARARFGIQAHEVVVGSFQKDGEGWGEGETPKPIKGPDVFLAAVEQLARELPVFVLLSGPARGYVKRGLERLNIRYAHEYAADRDALAKLYHALDLYLVTSREEGGPMALMESMASGVPVVSTRVGMAPDLIIDGESGALVDVGDVDAIARRSRELLILPDRGRALVEKAREAVKVADWTVVARRHVEEVWQPLLSEMR